MLKIWQRIYQIKDGIRKIRNYQPLSTKRLICWVQTNRLDTKSLGYETSRIRIDITPHLNSIKIVKYCIKRYYLQPHFPLYKVLLTGVPKACDEESEWFSELQLSSSIHASQAACSEWAS